MRNGFGRIDPPGCQASSLQADDAEWIRAYRPLRDVKHRLSKRTMRNGFRPIVPSGMSSIVSRRGRCEMDSGVSSPPGCQASSLQEDDAKWIRAYRPLRDVKHRLSKRTMRSGFERIVPSGMSSIVSRRGRCAMDSSVSSPPGCQASSLEEYDAKWIRAYRPLRDVKHRLSKRTMRSGFERIVPSGMSSIVSRRGRCEVDSGVSSPPGCQASSLEEDDAKWIRAYRPLRDVKHRLSKRTMRNGFERIVPSGMSSIVSRRVRCEVDSSVSSPPGCQASSLEEDDAKWIRAYRPLRDVKHRLSKRTMRSGFERIVPSGMPSIVSRRGRCEVDSSVSSPPGCQASSLEGHAATSIRAYRPLRDVQHRLSKATLRRRFE